MPSHVSRSPGRSNGPPATWKIVAACALILSLSMGLRQSLGLFLQPMTLDLGISAAAFGLAMAVQNLVWGLAQPVVGGLADRHGPRPVVIGCALVYVVGLVVMAQGIMPFGLEVGSVLIGVGVAGTGFGVLLGAAARAVVPARRMQTVGLVSAAGSLATLAIAPTGQHLITAQGWQMALVAFAAIAVMIVVAIPLGGRPAASQPGTERPSQTTAEALREAFAHPGFVAMTSAFFACGFQLMYITTHLPTYLAICGVAPGVGATALGVIGVGNAIGCYAAGQLGARYSQKRLLALIYLLRTLAIVCFLAMPVDAASTLLFAAAMGLLWLSVAPLVSGLIGHLFGLAHFNTLFGVAFLSHQVGAFLGSWLGGLTFDWTGSYATAWGSMIVVGLAAFAVQWFMDDAPRRSPGAALVPARA